MNGSGSQQGGPGGRGAEQARLELSVAASAAERANRPRHLVVIAGVLLAITLMYLLSGLFSLRSANAATRGERAQTQRLRGVINDLSEVEKAEAAKIHAPDPDIGAHLEMLMEEVGLTKVSVSVGDSSPGTKAVQRTYSASFKDQDVGLVLTWLSRAKVDQRFVGLDIESISLTPGKPSSAGKAQWNVDVRFRRLERK